VVSPLRVLVADDHEVMRLGLKILLTQGTGWQICGEAGTRDETIAKVRELLPDLVVLDLVMPGGDLNRAIQEMRSAGPGTKIVVFSIHNVPVVAKELGADGFVWKSAEPAELVSTIAGVMDIIPGACPGAGSEFVDEDRANPAELRFIDPDYSGPSAPRAKMIKQGTVRSVIRSLDPMEPEKAEITVHGADPLYREIRLENALRDDQGNEVRLVADQRVEVIIQADPNAPPPSDKN
jgi:DNA-binding NarL/FixJ family response regulator